MWYLLQKSQNLEHKSMPTYVPTISVLIPIFNFDVETLIERLALEARQFASEIEIICADDFSHHSFRNLNREVCLRHSVKYIELDQNLGRSKIRNFLAQQALGTYLLFIDCDSAISPEGFLAKYLQSALPNVVIYGGRIYEAQIPVDPKKQFHWKYGHQVEAPNLEKRQLMGHMAFQSNNFLIPKTLFSDLSFDEEILGYGYEDLMLAQILFNKGIKIRHLDNPVIHIGLEDQIDFFKKTKNAISNLAILYVDKKPIETRLTKLIDHTEKTGFRTLINLLAPAFERVFFKALTTLNTPPIWIFQGWKFFLFYIFLRVEEKKRTDL